MMPSAEGQCDRVSAIASKRSSSVPAINFLPIFVGLVLVSAIMLTISNLLSIGFVFERNYNEGWNIYNTQRLINHELIYDDNDWRVNNYPIVSFLIVAGVDFVVHNLLLSGRSVALVSFVAVGILAAAATRRFGGDRVDAVFGGASALALCYLIAPGWVAVDDPQTLGEAVMLGGLVSYISRPPDRFSLLRTALLITLAGFIKHNLIAIPLAITFDLAIRSPRRLLPFWLVCCGGLAAGLLGLTYLVAGGTFIDHLLSPRIFTWHGARYHLMKYLRLCEFPLVVILLFSRDVFSRDRLVLAAYGVISIAAATGFSGFEGTSYNMFQDAAVFLAIAGGVLLRELRNRLAARGTLLARAALGVAPLLLVQPILARSPQAFDQVYDSGSLLEVDRGAERSFLADAQYVADRNGLAICESLLLCYQAGQPFTLDPFNSRQYILAGRLDQGKLVRRIAAREFAVIQLRGDVCDDPEAVSCNILHYPKKFNRFTDEVLYAVDLYYTIGRRSQFGTFYVPK